MGRWVPVDKSLVRHLPVDREYTILEATFSIQVDIDSDEMKSVRSYARIWQWSRRRVEKFMGNFCATSEPEVGQKRATSEPHENNDSSNLQTKVGQVCATSEPEVGQKRATTKKTNKNPYVEPSSESKKLAWLLATEITKRNPDAVGLKTETQKIEKAKKWAKDIDLLLRVDGVSFTEATRVLLWCQHDRFWCVNILSGAKFRSQFPQLQLKSKAQSSGEKPTPENNPKCVTPEWY